MTHSLPDLEARLAELDRMMENLRQSIFSQQYSLESLTLQKRALIERINKLKAEARTQHETH